MTFTIRDMLWLTLLGALVSGWWLEHSTKLNGAVKVVQGNIELRQENDRLRDWIGRLYREKNELERENEMLERAK